EKAFKCRSGLILDLACQIRIGMREQSRADDVESVAIPAFFRVEMRTQREALGFGLIPAPHRCQCLEVIDDVLPTHSASRKCERDLPQAPLRSCAAIARCRCHTVARERVLVASKTLV